MIQAKLAIDKYFCNETRKQFLQIIILETLLVETRKFLIKMFNVCTILIQFYNYDKKRTLLK